MMEKNQKKLRLFKKKAQKKSHQLMLNTPKYFSCISVFLFLIMTGCGELIYTRSTEKGFAQNATATDDILASHELRFWIVPIIIALLLFIAPKMKNKFSKNFLYTLAIISPYLIYNVYNLAFFDEYNWRHLFNYELIFMYAIQLIFLWSWMAVLIGIGFEKFEEKIYKTKSLSEPNIAHNSKDMSDEKLCSVCGLPPYYPKVDVMVNCPSCRHDLWISENMENTKSDVKGVCEQCGKQLVIPKAVWCNKCGLHFLPENKVIELFNKANS